MERVDGFHFTHAEFKLPAEYPGLEFLEEVRMQRFGNHLHSGVS